MWVALIPLAATHAVLFAMILLRTQTTPQMHADFHVRNDCCGRRRNSRRQYEEPARPFTARCQPRTGGGRRFRTARDIRPIRAIAAHSRVRRHCRRNRDGSHAQSAASKQRLNLSASADRHKRLVRAGLLERLLTSASAQKQISVFDRIGQSGSMQSGKVSLFMPPNGISAPADRRCWSSIV
jgi:hypothetical protein